MIDLRRLRDRLREQGSMVLLVGLSVLAGILWLFVELVDELVEGDAQAFDEAVLKGFRDPSDPSQLLGPHWMADVARDITALGSTIVLTLLTLAVIGFVLLGRNYRTAAFVFVSVVGGTLLSHILKVTIERPRPDVVPHVVEVTSMSFPSGHTMLATTTYLTLAAVASRILPNWERIYLLGCAALISFLVGMSRIALGVHWPTDVLAGWCLGAAWALMCALVALWLQRRGAIEPAPQTIR